MTKKRGADGDVLVWDGDALRPLTDEEVAQREQDAADAIALQAKETTAETNEDALRGRADGAIATLENAIGGWAGLTAAQKDAALKLSVRVTIALARLVLRRLDSAGV